MKKRIWSWILTIPALTGFAMAAPAGDLGRAQSLCEQGNYLEAVDRFDRILTAGRGAKEVAEAEVDLDHCVGALARTKHGDDLLIRISRQYAGRIAAAKALGMLAQWYPVKGGLCRAQSPYDEELFGHYGRSREAARVLIVRAIDCLRAGEDERRAIRDLEEVANTQAGQPEGAFALLRIGDHYRDVERRDQAAIFYRRVVEEYPGTIEYPPGLPVVKRAQSGLDELHTYMFSPLIDRFWKWIDLRVLRGALGVDSDTSSVLSMLFVYWLIPVGALGLVALIVGMVCHRRGSPGDPADPILSRPWSLRSAAALLVGVWSLQFLLNLLVSVAFEKGYERFWTFMGIYQGTRPVYSVVVIALVLRHERLSRVFGIDGKRLGRLIVSIPAAIVAMPLLAVILVLPLAWAGFLKLGPSVDRYLSSEHSEVHLLPSVLWVPVLILAALAEELLFRGVLHDALRRAVPLRAATVLGSFVFAMAHLYPLSGTIAAFATGVVLVALREKFDSLAPPLAAHCLWNLLMAFGR